MYFFKEQIEDMLVIKQGYFYLIALWYSETQKTTIIMTTGILLNTIMDNYVVY